MIGLTLGFLRCVEHKKKSVSSEAQFAAISHVLFFAVIYVEKAQFRWQTLPSSLDRVFGAEPTSTFLRGVLILLGVAIFVWLFVVLGFFFN